MNISLSRWRWSSRSAPAGGTGAGGKTLRTGGREWMIPRVAPAGRCGNLTCDYPDPPFAICLRFSVKRRLALLCFVPFKEEHSQ